MTTGPDGEGAGGPASAGSRDDVVWLRSGPDRAPRRAAPLTLAGIVASAVAELDEHGADRLTMRRLAGRLEVTSTALYWHVATKEDLLDLALDHVVGEVPIPDPAPGPRAALRALLRDWRAAMLAHPWSPGLLGRPLLGPNVLARTEFLQAMLARAGLSGVGLASATSALSAFVIGAAMVDATWRRLDDPGVVARAQAHIVGHGEDYPTLSTSGFADRAWSDHELFDRSLDRILDAVLPASQPDGPNERAGR